MWCWCMNRNERRVFRGAECQQELAVRVRVLVRKKPESAWNLLGGQFDPERFDPHAVRFEDPKER